MAETLRTNVLFLVGLIAMGLSLEQKMSFTVLKKKDFELDNRKICDFVIFQIFKKINQLMLKDRRSLELLNTASFYLIDAIMEKADKLTEKNEKEENN